MALVVARTQANFLQKLRRHNEKLRVPSIIIRLAIIHKAYTLATGRNSFPDSKTDMLPISLASNLANAAYPVIAKVLGHGGAQTARPTGEVSAVCTMTLDGFDEITAAWSPILKSSGFTLDLHAVFCHSRPHVSFAPVPHPQLGGNPNPRKCELADLLIVMDHVDPHNNIDERRAVLVQAKMLKANKLQLSGREWIQHELLAWRQAFTFVDQRYDPRTRDLNSSAVGAPLYTAEYGGIDLKSSPPQWQHEFTQTIKPWFGGSVPLAGYLAQMATGSLSCGREAVRGGSDDWSFTVDELLRITAALPISKSVGSSRGNSHVIGLMVEPDVEGGTDGGDGGDHIAADSIEWPEGPISTVHLRIGSIDERRD